MASITPDFGVLSRYNNLVNVDIVRFGANSNVLESELNEMQQALNFKRQQMISFAFNDGLSTLGNMSFADGVFAITGTFALVGGILIYISTSSISASIGTDIYLDVWSATETYASTLHKYGNVQEAAVTNYMMDPILGQETSRREVIHYALATATGQTNHSYLYLAKIGSGGVLQKKASLVSLKYTAIQGKKEDIFTATAGQTAFTLVSGTYTPGIGQLDVFINGVRQPRSSFTETSSTMFTFKASNLPAGAEVAAVYG